MRRDNKESRGLCLGFLLLFLCGIKLCLHIEYGSEPTLEESLPYFARLQKGGTYFGTSGAAKAKNRYCREHFLETTTQETTTAPPAETSGTEAPAYTSPSSTVGTTVTTPRATAPATGDTRTTTATTPAATTPAATTSAATTPQATTGTAKTASE